jgi:hypothetical protein
MVGKGAGARGTAGSTVGVGNGDEVGSGDGAGVGVLMQVPRRADKMRMLIAVVADKRDMCAPWIYDLRLTIDD